MTRSIPEWIGRTPDSVIPTRVLLRVFQRTNGDCANCGAYLRAGRWHADHVLPLWDGGEHRESNLQALCEACHLVKTGEEAGQRAEARRHQKKAAGIRQSRNPLPGGRQSRQKKKLSGEVVER